MTFSKKVEWRASDQKLFVVAEGNTVTRPCEVDGLLMVQMCMFPGSDDISRRDHTLAYGLGLIGLVFLLNTPQVNFEESPVNASPQMISCTMGKYSSG